ncbi:hypothetical protein [Deinococcus pimensis]|uniref:hypothetical protein n=1 Tax=Deinococcus pimensis TaxID=309888 RepID=UPI0012FB496F|nr:hypothetical protein [Deinococcus pimensis]
MRSKFLFLATSLLIAATPRRLGPTGTHDLDWLKNQRDRTVMQLDPAAVNRIVDTELAAHNRRADAMVGTFAARVDDRTGVDSTRMSLTGEMVEVDEYGRARTQITHRAGDVAFPLRRYQFANGFTADFLRKRTGADVAAALENAQAAHRKTLVREIRDRIFSPVNYDFEDFLVDRKVLKIVAAYNGDNTVPPMSPNMREFAGTHSHYMAFAGFTASALDALIDNVAEHTDNAAIEVHLAPAQEAAARALPGFAPTVDTNIRVSVNDTIATAPLNTRNTGNRQIGRYRGADIWIKPWVFDGYGYALDTAAATPPLGLRVPDDVADQGLRLIGQIATFPLQSDYLGAEFGFGFRNRSSIAVAYFGGNVYVDPTNRDW